ncbi:MAG: hypothetical protein ACYTEQ_06180 [Planctomycetota bacterium]|jgi:hypothetical protein
MMLINKLARLNCSSRNAASLALMLIAALAMYNWMVAPYAAYLLAARRYESVVNQAIQKKEAVSKTVETKRKKLEQLYEQSSLLQSIFFTDDKSREFFSDLQVISEQSGLVVNAVNLIQRPLDHKSGHPQKVPGAAAKSAVLSVVGGYDNVIRLLQRLQARTEKVWIDSVKMQTLDYRSAFPRCDITITIYTIQNKESTL